MVGFNETISVSTSILLFLAMNMGAVDYSTNFCRIAEFEKSRGAAKQSVDPKKNHSSAQYAPRNLPGILYDDLANKPLEFHNP